MRTTKIDFQSVLKRLTIVISLLFTLSFTAFAGDYYWVGGSGNWTDYANHWATTSGGTTFHNQIPRTTDNVYFDANSFSAQGQTITLDTENGSCNNIDWRGVLYNPTFKAEGRTLKIYGSMKLIPEMKLNELKVSMEATSGSQTVHTGSLKLRELSFNGIGGEWTLQDSVSAHGLLFRAGTLNTNNQ